MDDDAARLKAVTSRRAFIRNVGLAGMGLGIGLPFGPASSEAARARLIRDARWKDRLMRDALWKEPIAGVEFGSSKFYVAVGQQMADGLTKILAIAKSSYRVENQTPTLFQAQYHLCTALWAAQEASDVRIGKSHLATDGPKSLAQSNIALLEMLGVEAGEVAHRVIPCAAAVLSSEEKDRGALVIDLGALQTGHIAYLNGEIKDYGSQRGGGFHVSQDLASHLHIPWANAESLKTENGDVFASPSAPAEGFQKIVCLRLRTILEKTKERLISKGVRLSEMRTGIHLTGGGSNQRGIVELATEVFGVPACVTRAKGFLLNDGIVEMPQHSCVLGLLKLCAFNGEETPRRRYFGLVPE